MLEPTKGKGRGRGNHQKPRFGIARKKSMWVRDKAGNQLSLYVKATAPLKKKTGKEKESGGKGEPPRTEGKRGGDQRNACKAWL